MGVDQELHNHKQYYNETNTIRLSAMRRSSAYLFLYLAMWLCEANRANSLADAPIKSRHIPATKWPNEKEKH
jgi:hypothetical protein